MGNKDLDTAVLTFLRYNDIFWYTPATLVKEMYLYTRKFSRKTAWKVLQRLMKLEYWPIEKNGKYYRGGVRPLGKD